MSITTYLVIGLVIVWPITLALMRYPMHKKKAIGLILLFIAWPICFPWLMVSWIIAIKGWNAKK